MNKQNMQYLNNENLIHERLLHGNEVIVWCAINSEGIIGPYFSEENNHAAIIISEWYVNAIQQFLEPQL